MTSLLKCGLFSFVLSSGASVAMAQQTAPAPQPQGAPGWMSMAMLVGMFFFMWLFMIRPQAKKQKEHRTFLNSLQVGQEVLTQGGLIGKVTSIADAIITVDFGSGAVRVLKSSIVQEIKAGAAIEAPATNNT